jgi:hypothetical protein
MRFVIVAFGLFGIIACASCLRELDRFEGAVDAGAAGADVCEFEAECVGGAAGEGGTAEGGGAAGDGGTAGDDPSPNQAGGGGIQQSARETICADNADNDRDGKLDCGDPDCVGQICGAKRQISLAPTRDLERTTLGHGFSDLDGAATIEITTNPKQSRWGVLEFEQIGALSNVKINWAVLDISIMEGPGRVELRSGAGQVIDTKIEAPEESVSHYDVSATLRNWMVNPTAKRVFELHFVSSTFDEKRAFYATEHLREGPRLKLEYEAACSTARVCPEL